MIGSEYKQQTRIKCLQNLVILCINFEQSNNDVCYFDRSSFHMQWLTIWFSKNN